MLGFRPVDRDIEMFEAAAIILHLADQHPEAGVAPPAPLERTRHRART
jgi:glutathione S-transferase